MTCLEDLVFTNLRVRTYGNASTSNPRAPSDSLAKIYRDLEMEYAMSVEMLISADEQGGKDGTILDRSEVEVGRVPSL